MTTAASSLLDFILSLFTDEEAAARYREDPTGELARAGLHGVSPADVDAVAAMETDFAPLSTGGGDDCGDDEGHRPVPVRHEDDHDDDHHDGHHDHGHGRGSDNHGGSETAVIQHVENSYNTTTTTEIEIEHGIWAGGDAIAIWGDDVVVATDGSVAAGDDVEDVSVDNRVDVDVEDSFNDNSTEVEGVGNAVGAGAEVEDSFNTDIDVEDSFDVENSGNTQHGTGNVVGEGNVVDNSTDNSVEVELENSLNQIDGNSNNVGEDNTSHDESTDLDLELEVEDSFNTDNSTDVEFDESFNTDNSVDAEFDESFNTDNSTEIEDSLNDNAIAVDEAIANTGDVDVDA